MLTRRIKCLLMLSGIVLSTALHPVFGKEVEYFYVVNSEKEISGPFVKKDLYNGYPTYRYKQQVVYRRSNKHWVLGAYPIDADSLPPIMISSSPSKFPWLTPWENGAISRYQEIEVSVKNNESRSNQMLTLSGFYQGWPIFTKDHMTVYRFKDSGHWVLDINSISEDWTGIVLHTRRPEIEPWDVRWKKHDPENSKNPSITENKLNPEETETKEAEETGESTTLKRNEAEKKSKHDSIATREKPVNKPKSYTPLWENGIFSAGWNCKSNTSICKFSFEKNGEAWRSQQLSSNLEKPDHTTTKAITTLASSVNDDKENQTKPQLSIELVANLLKSSLSEKNILATLMISALVLMAAILILKLTKITSTWFPIIFRTPKGASKKGGITFTGTLGPTKNIEITDRKNLKDRSLEITQQKSKFKMGQSINFKVYFSRPVTHTIESRKHTDARKNSELKGVFVIKPNLGKQLNCLMKEA